MCDTMMSSATTGYENNWHNMMIKAEPMDPTSQFNVHESDSPISNFDTRNMFFESNLPNNITHSLGFNPLTPPGYPNVLLTHQRHQIDNQRPTTPCSTYTTSSMPPMSLSPSQTPPKSPTDNNESPEKHSVARSESVDSYDDRQTPGSIDDDEDDESIKTPRVNSHGKIRKHKCKQCGYVAVTKLTYWEHIRVHIKPEKMLSCSKCPFVTEYKHHLEYHLRNHDRSKPYECLQCSYTCVNKSMLNSHLKSHSAVLQFRCADCTYGTKYCHSLKMHLRKYKHKPDVVLNPDGTPNPLPIIDVYGTRRGPKTKANQTKADTELRRRKMKEHSIVEQPQSQPSLDQSSNVSNNANNNHVTQLMPNTLANIFQHPSSYFPYLNLNFQMLAAQQQAIAQLSPSIRHSPVSNSATDTEDALNLSRNKSPLITMSEKKPFKANENINTTPSRKDRRKGRAYKIQQADNELDDSMDESPAFKSIQNRQDSPLKQVNTSCQNNKTSNNSNNNNKNSSGSDYSGNNNSSGNILTATTTTAAAAAAVVASIPKEPKIFECKFCDISFKDDVLYTIHMGYHGYNDVFKCNMCGEKCDDRVSFFLHIARNSHT